MAAITAITAANVQDEVFRSSGQGKDEIPIDARRVLVDPSVTEIADEAFRDCKLLAEVAICEGVVKIGKRAFYECHALKRLALPSTLREIDEYAFYKSALKYVRIPDGVESIGGAAFAHTKLTNIRYPNHVTAISRMFGACRGMFSSELPEGVAKVEELVFAGCRRLRNVAIPQNCDVSRLAFDRCSDLLQLFGSKDQIARDLKWRFDMLPIHRLMYYQSYHPVRETQLNYATNTMAGLDPTGNRQDCLGMTPLHILACSTAQQLTLYEWVIEKYPENLVTQDRWGALPILYSLWGDAPNEIVQLLVESYKSIHPRYRLNWSGMVETLGKANAPTDVALNLLHVNQSYFPAQHIDWANVLGNLASDASNCEGETFYFLVKCSFAMRSNILRVKQLRSHFTRTELERIHDLDKAGILDQLQSEYDGLKECAPLIELAVWKVKIDECGENKDDVEFRRQCRIICGADDVVKNVLPFLL